MKHRTSALLHFALLFSLITLPLSAKAQIEGVVLDDTDKTPIPVVSVKAIRDGKTIDFANTDDKGRFILKKATAPVLLTFRHLGYAKKTVEVTSADMQRILLSPASTQLKNVTVLAARVQLRGDTTSYLTNQYASKKDVTIGDALKKMPGVSVNSAGTVSYLGKAVDKLKVDGKELMGKDYQVIIQNLKHSGVARVEIMERQQEVKALKGLVADDKLIMNLVLNRSSRGRLNGNAEVGIGGEKSGVDYLAGVNLIYLLGKVQTVANAEYKHNFDAYNEREARSYEEIPSTSAIAPLLSSGLGASAPEVSDIYFRNKTGGKGSFNTGLQVGQDADFRLNASVADFDYSHRYGNDITYFVPGQSEIRLSEDNVLSQVRDRDARVKLTYQKNADQSFFSNTLTYRGHQTLNTGTFESPDRTWGQRTDQMYHIVHNSLRGVVKYGSHALNLSNSLSAEIYPRMNLFVEDFSQFAKEQILKGTLSAWINQPLWKNWNLFLNSDYSVRHDKADLPGNHTLTGLQQNITVNPRLTYTKDRNEFLLSLPLTYTKFDISSTGHDGFRKAYWDFSPRASFRYNFNSTWSVYVNTRMARNLGDITDFIQDPVRTSYRSAYSGPGVLTETCLKAAMMQVYLRKPLDELFGQVLLSYDETNSNMISQDYPSETINVISKILMPHGQRSFWGYVSLSKNFARFQTKVGGNVGMRYNSSSFIRQGVSSRLEAQSIYGSFNLDMEPFSQIELSYNLNLSTNILKYGDTRMSGLLTLSHNGSISYVPSQEWSFGVDAEHLMKEITQHDYSHLFLMGLTGQYKSGSHVVKLSVANLLNQQEYRFSLYNGANMYSSWYSLRGINGLLSYRYYF